MAYNGFPILVENLDDASIYGQLDASGLKVSTHVSSDTYVSIEDGQQLQIVKTDVSSNTFTSALTSQSFTLSQVLSSVASYVFQVSSSFLRWTDVSGNTIQLGKSGDDSQMIFSNPKFRIDASSNKIVSSDGTYVYLGSSTLYTQLLGSMVDAQNDFKITAGLVDYQNSFGSVGQVLTSTGQGHVQWSTVTLPIDNSTVSQDLSATNMVSATPQFISSGSLDAGTYYITAWFKFTATPSSVAGIRKNSSSAYISTVNNGTSQLAPNYDGVVVVYGLNTSAVSWSLACSYVVTLASSGNLYAGAVCDFVVGSGAGAYVELVGHASYIRLV